ncbi:glucosamine inositolphosphorylceramide transferase family protein [Prevotella aurantiaca]
MLLKTFIKKLTNERWNIGFIQNSTNDIINGHDIEVKWIIHNFKDSWFADPFILDVTDKEITLLVEEFYKPIGKGRIAKLIIDRITNVLIKRDIILELPTHLSFPLIIRKDNKVEDFIKDIDTEIESSTEPFVYLLPENGESGHLYIYKYFIKTNQIIRLHCILNEAVEDAVPIKIDKNSYLFCTPRENPNGNVLHVYKWSCIEKLFLFKKEIYLEENTARMSGSFFYYKDILIRPTQECNTQYGHAVTLQETDITNFSFIEVRKIYSVHPKLNIGCHTFNSYKGIIVTDALGFDRMWIRKMLKRLKLI